MEAKPKKLKIHNRDRSGELLASFGNGSKWCLLQRARSIGRIIRTSVSYDVWGEG